MDGDSGDEGNDELTCVRSDSLRVISLQAGELHWEADSVIFMNTGTLFFSRPPDDSGELLYVTARAGFTLSRALFIKNVGALQLGRQTLFFLEKKLATFF